MKVTGFFPKLEYDPIFQIKAKYFLFFVEKSTTGNLAQSAEIIQEFYINFHLDHVLCVNLINME